MGSVVATAGLLFGGAGAGMAVARLVAPGSELAQMIGFLVLPLALVTGFQLWLGAAIVLLLPRTIRAIRRGERPVVSPPERNAVPPGHSVFVATGTGWGVLAGVGIGLVPSAGSFVAAAGAFAGLGLAYGLAARALAQRGLVPFPAEG